METRQDKPKDDEDREGALFDAGPRLDGSPPRAASRLRAELAAELAAFGEVRRIGQRGEGLPKAAHRAGEAFETDRGWPDFILVRENRVPVIVRAVAATEVSARRVPRQWDPDTVVLERSFAIDGATDWPVVLAFDDGLAVRVADMREGRHWEHTGRGHNAHVVIVDRDRRPLVEVLA